MSEQPEDDLPNTRNVGGVVRVGDTVRRPAGPWTPAVHALLAHLHESGFDFAPRPLGIDGAGREILTYIDGDTEMTPVAHRVWFDALPEAARRLRQLHDLTVDFVPPDGAVWREPFGDLSRLGRPPHASDDEAEVICHGDWGKHNAVFRDGRLVGMIDWDCARPERRLYDIGWFALEWCPVGEPGIVGPALRDPMDQQPARLRLLCDAYGLDDRSEVLGAVWSRLETFIEWLEAGAAAGDPLRKQRVEAGKAAHHRRRLEYLDDVQEKFAAALR
ncbi:MAG: aminoglycoside phosphotransferase family protein [Dehalococcoidia bacterium]